MWSFLWLKDYIPTNELWYSIAFMVFVTSCLIRFTQFLPIVRGIVAESWMLIFGEKKLKKETMAMYHSYLESLFLIFFQLNFFSFFPYCGLAGPVEYIYAYFLAFMVISGIIGLMFKFKRHYFFNSFSDPQVPLWISKFLFLIEFISFFMRMLSLSLRLFANATAGGMLLKMFILLVTSILLPMFSWMGGFGLMMIVVILMVLELAVAFLQTILLFFLFMMYLREIF